ncbi:MAG: type II secretion system protein GspG [Pontiellaceae bacterium]|nr:type II secretion system protein GspG [Pontiellaceae bacterium]
MENKNSKRHSAKRSGFTLIEIILVVVIIGILAGIAIPNIGNKSDKAKISAGKANISTLDTAVSEYQMMNGEYPSSLDQLLDEAKGGPYLKKMNIPKDPWGNEFVYSAPGSHNTHSFDISASGHEEDVNNWD